LHHRDIIVMGASAGGLDAVRLILGGLPKDLPASVFVVMHISADGPGLLAQVLTRHSRLPVSEANDREPMRPARVYVSRPDHHLILERDRVRVMRGPKQNRHRPAIDPLFRSAAVVYGPRVVGVVLTGNLDDGTAGLRAVKDRGGFAIVQDPLDAEFPAMPQSALNHVEVDLNLPAARIAEALVRAVQEPLDVAPPTPRPDLEIEVRSDSGEGRMEDMEAIGAPSVFTCPECSGTLWEVGDDDLPRFRCRVGHAYTSESLVAEQDDALEDALWAALRSLEENATLARRMAERFRSQAGTVSLADRYVLKARTHDHHANALRRLLTEKPPVEKVPQEEPTS
jgi:two-component system chemotaxis response regulator CheB